MPGSTFATTCDSSNSKNASWSSFNSIPPKLGKITVSPSLSDTGICTPFEFVKPSPTATTTPYTLLHCYIVTILNCQKLLIF